MEWSFKAGMPIYTQIIEMLRIHIAIGTYKPGEKIPPVRELAIEAAVNPNTMQRALVELEREGLFYTERTNGRFVTGEVEVLKNLKEDLAKEYVRDLFEKLSTLGFNKEEVMGIVKEWTQEVAK